jgi:thiol-disulfide isomerase/thioredoxin
MLTGFVRTLGHAASLTAGMLSAPRATLSRIGRGDGASPIWPVLGLVLVTTLINAKVMTRLVLLLGHGASTTIRRMREVMEPALRTDAAVLAITCVVVAVLASTLSKGRVRAAHAAAAAGWLLVPLIALKALGGTLSVFGVNAWFMPHLAVDSSVVIVNGEVDWLRFAIKCLVAYAWPLTSALLFVVDAARGADRAAPTKLWQRAGAAGAVILSLVLVAATVYDVERHAERIRPVLPGDPAPAFSLRELTGAGVGKKRISLEALKGNVVVIDFWASWCNPCRRSMPELSQIAAELGSRGLKVIGINREPEAPEEAAKALRAIAPHFPSVIDDRHYGERLGLTTLPTSFVLDRQGIVRHFHMGYVEANVIRAEIEALLATP